MPSAPIITNITNNKNYIISKFAAICPEGIPLEKLVTYVNYCNVI